MAFLLLKRLSFSNKRTIRGSLTSLSRKSDETVFFSVREGEKAGFIHELGSQDEMAMTLIQMITKRERDDDALETNS